MKISIRFTVFVCCWMWVCQACIADTFEARVIYINDGDSLIVKSGTRKIRVRLWGIDSPEKGQPFSSKAKDYTSSLLLGRVVTIKPVERDVYGRLVAEVFLHNRNSSEEIVRAGFGWVHIFYCRTKKCQSWRILESEARKSRKGLWAEDDPVPPWEWKRQRNQYKQRSP